MEYVTTIAANEPIAITIGNFDGVHKGHQYLMHELKVTAHALNCTPVLVTFSPHTLLVVRPDIEVRYLTTLEEKLVLAKDYGGIDNSIVISFTPEVAAMSAGAFLDSLASHFAMRAMVVGANFSLGHNRMGDVAFLEQYGQEHGVLVRALPLEEAGRTRISSTRIRALVSAGLIGEANELLGHALTLSDVVRHGEQRGRLLGFPTANLLPEAHKLLPADGVYVVRVRIAPEQAGVGMATSSTIGDAVDASTVYNGVVNIGVRPTFDGKVRIVEVHLLDIEPYLYERRITIDFMARLRGEQRFSGIEALKTQIAADVQEARRILEMF